MTDINWQDLAAPIPQKYIKERKGPGNKRLSYITARTVMNRLDQVLTPAGWKDEFTATDGGAMCTLYIRVDGEWVGKTDIGSDSNIEEDKGAFSDAFKRAAVKWGIGRELYNEGTAYGNGNTKAAPKGRPQDVPPATANGDSGEQIDWGKVLTHATGTLGYKNRKAVIDVVGEPDEYTGTKAELNALLTENAPKAKARQ